MDKYNEVYCLAILINSLKSRKRYPDAITVAECAKFLYDMYGSFEIVAQKVGSHSSVIRKWVNLTTAPDILKQAVKDGRIYPVAAFAILSGIKDRSKREQVTVEVSGWGEPEIVRFVKLVKENPQLPVPQVKDLFISHITRQLQNDTKK